MLSHDSTCPHTAAYNVEILNKLDYEVLKHSQYSPDLAPSDFHLFVQIKQPLRSCPFITDQHLKETVHASLVPYSKNVILRA